MSTDSAINKYRNTPKNSRLRANPDPLPDFDRSAKKSNARRSAAIKDVILVPYDYVLSNQGIGCNRDLTLRYNARAITQKYAGSRSTSSHYFNIIANSDTVANHDRTSISSQNGARTAVTMITLNLNIRISLKVALSRE
jgi:hypothetical protein